MSKIRAPGLPTVSVTFGFVGLGCLEKIFASASKSRRKGETGWSLSSGLPGAQQTAAGGPRARRAACSRDAGRVPQSRGARVRAKAAGPRQLPQR